ncbi:MAG: hypothetical protein NPIRA01_33940 [Nitrospirales bacterium]|nr:MAG: hypothetical protein NPIRA01_33940 [Nitrospirales bacterium]
MMNSRLIPAQTYQLCPKPYSYLVGFAVIFWALLFSGCVAQKADLARVQKDLEEQIKQLNQDKQELEEIISTNREEAESLQTQQSAAMKDLFRARAEIRQELKALREADLTTLTGDIEELNFRVKNVRQDFDAQTSQTNDRFQTLETQVGEHETTLESKTGSTQGQLTALIQQIDEDSQTRNQQLSDFQTSLSSFKDSMEGLGSQLVQETERASQANTELRNQLDQKIDELNTSITSLDNKFTSLDDKFTSLETEVQTHKTNLQDVSESVGQIRGALEKSGTLVGGQVTTLETNLKQLEAHVNSLTEKLNSDTQALRGYLEKDVKASINSMNQTLQSQVENIETQTQSNTGQVDELTQSVRSLKEKQEFVGGLLGERGDKFMQESGRLNERLNLMESHQSDLTQKIESNTQSVSKHLSEVNSSVASVTQALENTNASLHTRLESQEQKIQDLSKTINSIQKVKGDLEANLSTLEMTSQSSNEMRKALQKMNTRLQELEVHQSGLVGKLDADGQAMNNHLSEVNAGIQSVASALEQVDKNLRSKINVQSKKLNQAMTDFQSTQGSSEDSQANIAHLNQLTKSLNQLRDVVTTIGTKLGGRVDQHESRLSELAKRVNLLSSRGKK